MKHADHRPPRCSIDTSMSILPRLAMPRRAVPCQAAPALPNLAMPRPAEPCPACLALPSLAMHYPATPCRTSPRLPCDAMPRLTRPHVAAPCRATIHIGTCCSTVSRIFAIRFRTVLTCLCIPNAFERDSARCRHDSTRANSIPSIAFAFSGSLWSCETET